MINRIIFRSVSNRINNVSSRWSNNVNNRINSASSRWSRCFGKARLRINKLNTAVA